uniref:Uncharacterized protein n=1 Tax=Opuntia streptacantha TaxID=393608 RepID=A0A7C9A580_OPUST
MARISSFRPANGSHPLEPWWPFPPSATPGSPTPPPRTTARTTSLVTPPSSAMTHLLLPAASHDAGQLGSWTSLHAVWRVTEILDGFIRRRELHDCRKFGLQLLWRDCSE